MISKLQANRVRRSYLGGARIDAFCGIPSSFQPFNLSTFQPPRGAAQPRPEDWLASTTQAFNGTQEIEGEGLGRLEDGRLVRDAVGALPILVKLLDSDERLVVQAHPTVPCAERLFHSPVGKTECWHFLPGMAPDACVYLGFKPGVTRTSWEQAVRECSQFSNVHKSSNDNCSQIANGKSGALGERALLGTGGASRPGEPGKLALPIDGNEDLRFVNNCGQLSQLPIVDNPLLSFLHRISVAPGDFVFVDGGVPHAIGGGCFMVELQEPSDLMVGAGRFTPSGRRIPDAKMHGGAGWERMFDVYEYDGRTYEETCARYVRRQSAAIDGHRSPSGASGAATRICGPEFTDKFEMWRLGRGGSVALGGASAVVVVTEGGGSLNGLPVKHGDRLVAAGESVLAATGAFAAIVCF
ncbi:MAG: class I mannose-6-phosphate isomerase [Kiritimatiellae bacterium]|nr:class I mannose-6-phosphate isomerase [Kiritimatiellia bacterium]